MLIDISIGAVIAICYIRGIERPAVTRRPQVVVIRSQRRLIYNVWKTSVKRRFLSNVKATSIQCQKK